MPSLINATEELETNFEGEPVSSTAASLPLTAIVHALDTGKTTFAAWDHFISLLIEDEDAVKNFFTHHDPSVQRKVCSKIK